MTLIDCSTKFRIHIIVIDDYSGRMLYGFKEKIDYRDLMYP